MTLDQVKSDLKEIQYYYAKQKELDGASRTVGASRIARFLGYDIRVRRCNQLKIGGCGKSRKMTKRTLNYMTELTRLCRINRP